jgi:hypothetical protein
VTETMPAPAPAPAETPRCHFCRLPVIPCPVRAEGYLTYCGGWVHKPPPGRDHGRHSCGTGSAGRTGGTRTPGNQAVPELIGGEKESK